MSDSIEIVPVAGRIGKAIDFIGFAPAENIRRDHMKLLRQGFAVRFPGNLGGCAVLAAVELYQIRPASSF